MIRVASESRPGHRNDRIEDLVAVLSLSKLLYYIQRATCRSGFSLSEGCQGPKGAWTRAAPKLVNLPPSSASTKV